MNDELNRLIQGASSGITSDLEELATRFQKMILVNCSLRLDDGNQVEDVAQEVTEQLISDIGQLRSPEAFTAWLERIIVRTCARNNKSNRRRKTLEIDLDTKESTSLINQLVEQDISQLPEASFDQNQAREHLLMHIQQLAPAQRVPLILHYFGAMSYRQIAEVLNVKIGSVSSNISKGKRNLNRRLIDEL
ncbi:MAG: RNA polymerase sigma factor [Coriobacteriia bacterium]|nr:RNA polymerase sigma factor [Coriobacteriia bacterium]